MIVGDGAYDVPKSDRPLVSKIKSFKILAVGVTQPLVLCVLFSDVIEKILLGDAGIRCGAFGEMSVKVFL